MDVIEIHMRKGGERRRDRMNQIMDEMFQLGRACLPRTSTCWCPPTDIYETREELVILVEMAGLRKEEIQVVLDQDLLLISGRRANPIGNVQRKVHQMEIDFGAFERRVLIQTSIDPSGVSALYREGFLTISIPKVSPVSREIQVEEPR